MKMTCVFMDEVRKAMALVLACSAISLPVAGEVSAELAQSLTNKTKASITGVMPSQTAGFVLGGSSNEVSGLESENSIIELRRAIYESRKWGPLSAEQFELAKRIFNEWREKELKPYLQLLRAEEGIVEERIPFCARVWYCVAGTKTKELNGKKLSFDLTREEIFEYAKGSENENVICNEEGEPMIWMVVNDKKIEEKAKKGFSRAINWYKENGMPDILESAAENGMSVYYVANTFADSGASLVWLDQWGQVCVDSGYDNTKGLSEKYWENMPKLALWVEPYGIKFFQVMEALKAYESEDRNRGNNEVVKSLIAGYVAQALVNGGNEDKTIKIDAESFPIAADSFAKDYSEYDVTVDGAGTRRLLWLMADFARIPGFGSLRDVPTFVEAMKRRPSSY